MQLHPPVFADNGAGIDKEACVIIGFLHLVFWGGGFGLLKTPVISKWQHQPIPCRE